MSSSSGSSLDKRALATIFIFLFYAHLLTSVSTLRRPMLRVDDWQRQYTFPEMVRLGSLYYLFCKRCPDVLKQHALMLYFFWIVQ